MCLEFTRAVQVSREWEVQSGIAEKKKQKKKKQWKWSFYTKALHITLFKIYPLVRPFQPPTRLVHFAATIPPSYVSPHTLYVYSPISFVCSHSCWALYSAYIAYFSLSFSLFHFPPCSYFALLTSRVALEVLPILKGARSVLYITGIHSHCYLRLCGCIYMHVHLYMYTALYFLSPFFDLSFILQPHNAWLFYFTIHFLLALFISTFLPLCISTWVFAYVLIFNCCLYTRKIGVRILLHSSLTWLQSLLFLL